jgi:superfamily II DNA or RNA helicase
MTIYYLSRYLEIAYNWSLDPKRLEVSVLSSQQRAVDLFEKTINGDAGLSAVQGPPGTGKTSVFDLGIRRVWEDLVNAIERTIVMYIAPTNHLVVEAFTRFAALLYSKGFKPHNIIHRVRVYVLR